jgi:hypothetical protein
MTQQEANIEIGKWLGLTIITNRHGHATWLIEGNENRPAKVPDYFSDEKAARGLVQRLQDQVTCWERFTVELDRLTGRQKGEPWFRVSFRYLLATPDQIARAACKPLASS